MGKYIKPKEIERTYLVVNELKVTDAVQKDGVLCRQRETEGVGEARSEECRTEYIVHQLQVRRGDSHIGGESGGGRQHEHRRRRRLDSREERGQSAAFHCQVRTSTRYIGPHLLARLPAGLTREGPSGPRHAAAVRAAHALRFALARLDAVLFHAQRPVHLQQARRVMLRPD